MYQLCINPGGSNPSNQVELIQYQLLYQQCISSDDFHETAKNVKYMYQPRINVYQLLYQH